MKRNIMNLLLAFILFANCLYAQKTAYTVTNEEKVQDSHSDRTTFRITFKDIGECGRVCQKSDGTWWVLIRLTKDDGPYATKDLAIKRLYDRSSRAANAGTKAGQAAGSAIGSAMSKKKIYLDAAGNKYYLQNGQRVYVK